MIILFAINVMITEIVLFSISIATIVKERNSFDSIRQPINPKSHFKNREKQI